MPGVTFTYDNNGNTLTKVNSSGTTQYAWDFENRLNSVVLPGTGGIVTFKYDPFGRRVQKSSSAATTNYLYDGSNSVEEVDQSGALLARYAQGAGTDEPLAEARGGTTALYEQDGLGSVTSLSGSAGTLANTYTYDSFGVLTASTGTMGNPFQYTGRDYDSETGLRYYRARYYSSDSGRFISADPEQFDADINFYAYVGGNPIAFVDPSGLICEDRGQKPKRCKIIVGWPGHSGALNPAQSRIQLIFSYAGIDVDFTAGSDADFEIQNVDLSYLGPGVLGYAPPGTNLAQVDIAAINAAGRRSNASAAAIFTATGVIEAHEIGHQLGLPHSSPGLMRQGTDIGDAPFKPFDFGSGLLFNRGQKLAIRRRCRQLRSRQH
jgi:RHS repeat-associated protein